VDDEAVVTTDVGQHQMCLVLSACPVEATGE